MFESMEIRKVKNGFILLVRTEVDEFEYVYDSSRKALKVMKEFLEGEDKNPKSS
jgi:hypothetical protein